MLLIEDYQQINNTENIAYGRKRKEIYNAPPTQKLKSRLYLSLRIYVPTNSTALVSYRPKILFSFIYLANRNNKLPFQKYACFRKLAYCL